MKTQDENIAKYSRVKRLTDHGQTELNNMPVKKGVLNEVNKERTFIQCSRTEGGSKGQHIKI